MSRYQETEGATRISPRLLYGRLIIAGIFAMTAVAAIFSPRANVLRTFSSEYANAQVQTQSPSGSTATEGTPPENLQTSEPSQTASTPGRQVLIDFSNLPFYTAVTTQYPDAIFSSDSSSYVITTPQNYGSALPNISRSYVYGYWVNGNPPYNHFAPLVVSFPKPVNDLGFHLLASDDVGVIAYVDIDQTNVYTKTEPIFGNGNPFSPVWINLGAAGYKNVTRIVVRAITDRKGLAFDNFSFTVPTATPTPTPAASPTPTPPSAPTNVKATPDEEEIFVSWTPSQGAAWYVIKRTEQQPAGSTSAPASESFAFAPIDSSFFCDGISIPCVYPDDNSGVGLSSDITYSYVVAAANNSGTSVDSSPPASSKPLPRAGCNASATPLPFGGSDGLRTRHGWQLNYRFSIDSGLELSNLSLNGRLMAEWMSAPYYVISAFNSRDPNHPPRTRGQLFRNGANPDGSLHSTLVGYQINPEDPYKLLIEATYKIDHIPGAPKACLTISQRYEFYREGLGQCEPSGKLPCSRFRPMVSYSFHGGDGEYLASLNIPQRHHYQVKGASGNAVGVFRDPDTILEGVSNGFDFTAKRNPVSKEFWSTIIGPRSTFVSSPAPDVRFDNFHQTNYRNIVEPSLTGSPGCPECVHSHWRWGRFLGTQWGNGSPLIPDGSTQTVDIGVVRYPGKVNSPQEWLSLVNGEDLYTTVSQDPVFWFSPTGYMSADVFFKHTAWFNPRPPATEPSNIEQSANSANSTTSQDGPVSVIFGDVYQEGTTTFDPFDINSLDPLPAGYASLNNTGYNITTTAIVSGPHIVNFSAASVTDQSAFDNMRIFHAEADPFDPDKLVWIDRTILSPDTPSPDFSAKTLSARTDELGVSVIAKLVQTVPPSSDVANLLVTCSDSADPITAGNELTYTIRVTNNGPQTANNVAIRNGLSTDVKFVSATPSQGTCKEIDGTVYCALNSLGIGSTTTVALVVQPIEGTGSFQAAGKAIYNGTLVRANETDNNQTNNSATESTTVLPNPNKPPIVNITSPIGGALIVGPTNITINATAADSDGTISKVEFFDNGELIGIGTPSGNNQYVITKQNASFGDHSLIAVATDNGGRQNISNPANVIVNGAADVNITSPSSGALFSPASNITVSASATHPSGIISKIEFFANGESIGIGPSLAWSNVSAGTYSIVAIATDGSGLTTTSATINITVDAPPTVTMSTPADGAVFPSLTNISLSATAQSALGSIVRVDFYANGILAASGSDVGTDQFTATWRHLADGFYSVTAIATDNLGVSTMSAPITIGVNTPTSQPGEFVWFDDALPPRAVKHAEGDVDWYWVDLNPGAFSGTKSHQSRSFGHLPYPNGFHQHFFEGATTTFPVNAGDKLFTYVFLDINDKPRELMLQWKDQNGWEHRAYWGANEIPVGTDDTNSRRYMGSLPEAGTWVRLEVPASVVGLEGSNLDGMAFTLIGGRATFDLAGKATATAAPAPTTPTGDFVWIEDDLPPGAVISFTDDGWNFVTATVYSGQRAHQTHSMDGKKFRQHAFTGAQTPMQINPGDVLFTYVYLGDPDVNHQPNTPDQIMLQWYDGTSWSHRAFWGTNWTGQNLSNMGRLGTEQQRYMGGLPAARGWYRLEVPASYVGLEGKSVSGMAFGAYRGGNNPFVTWDRSGKSSRLTTVPLTLSATTSIWRYSNGTSGWAYQQAEQPPATYGEQKRDAFFAFPNKAAGAVEMYRFVKGDSRPLYFYGTAQQYSGWTRQNVAFYVFPDGSTPGTVPVYRYYDSQGRYFLTIDQNDIALGMNNYDGIAAYVFANANLVPTRPTGLTVHCNLRWRDNSGNEDGFKIESRTHKLGSSVRGPWMEIGAVGANVTWFGISCGGTDYRVRAYNSVGNSSYSNEVWAARLNDSEPAPNSAPEISIIGPANGEVLDHDFVITANAFDLNGNGTIVKVEFLANGSKLGEVATAPHIFPWNNVPSGIYSLTAIATDAAGATTTSTPVNVTINGAITPYGGTPAVIPGRIEVENYDNGGASVAYNDTTPGTHGQDYDQPPNYPPPAFRQPTDVDIYKSAGYSNGYLLLGQTGDWSNYTVNVASGGTYTMQAQVAWGGTSGSPGTFHVEVDGVDKTGPLQIPDTNWTFTFVTKTGVQLTAGIHVMRLVCDTNAPNGYTGDVDYLNFTSSSGGAQNVTWTNAVGVSTSGHSLTKTAAQGWGNAGAASTQSIISGDGYAEFSSSGVTLFGLSHVDADQNYASIEFGIHVTGNDLYVYESGVQRGYFGTVAPTDRLSVAVEGGVVKYKKNGTVFYTSTVAPTYPLLVDTALYTNGSTISNVVVTVGGPQNVSWTNPVGVTASGNNLTKTAAEGWGNAGAASTQTIASGDGYAEFSASNLTLFGLSHADTDQNYTSIEFGLHIAYDGSLYVFESGVNRGLVGSATGTDRLRVSIESGVVKYRKNGTLLYTSTVAPAYPLLVDTALYTNGSTISNVVVTLSGPQNVNWTNTAGVSASGNNLTKTAAEGWGNSGAASSQTIVSGDGYAEFSASGIALFGLSRTDADQNYTSIEFGLHTSGNDLYVFESGVNRGLVGTVSGSDRLRVSVEGGVVKYRKNGTLLYTSTIAPNYPLLVDTALYTNGSTLSNVVISGNLGGGAGGGSSAQIR